MIAKSSQPFERSVEVSIANAVLRGDLVLLPQMHGIVLFAHGSGSSRHSPRNRFVAHALQDVGLATLLIDLLTVEEEAADASTGRFRFDIDLLAKRLAGAIDWLSRQTDTAKLPLGCFGASTGAGAALVAAAARPQGVAAVVSRGGRPDLAGAALARVQAPTRLIVGGLDAPVLVLNERALAALRTSHKDMVIVPGATHLFEEPGALEEVARLAAEWFSRHLHAA